MIISMIILLPFAIGSWQPASCSTIDLEANSVDGARGISPDEGLPVHDYGPERVAKNANFRPKRVPVVSTSTESSIRAAYERTFNRTTDDYYAKRRAVLERYYARQREIMNKFGRKTTSRSPEVVATMTNYPNDRRTFEDDTTPGEDSSVEDATVSSPTTNNLTVAEDAMTATGLSDEIKEGENNSSDVSWIYRSNNWNPKLLDNETDSDIEAESSNVSAERINKKEMPGYYRLGEFKGDNDERIIYQHNLGVGLRGSSSLEANFEVVLEGAFAITVIEAFPYANTRARFSWISGGPGTNSVKLKLKGYENEGFSYTVKVWGVPVQRG